MSENSESKITEIIEDPRIEKIYQENPDDIGNIISKIMDIEDNLKKSTMKSEVWELLITLLVDAYENERITQSELEVYAGDIADFTQLNHPKTTIINIVEERTTDDQSVSKVKHINDWVVENIDYVLVIQSEDKHADTKYQFKVNDGEEYIESEGLHRSWNEMKNKIHELSLERVAKPEFPDHSPYGPGDWTDFIDDFITQNHKIKEVPGTRSEYVKDLKINIRRAYTNKSDAIKTNQSYYDPENDVLWIPSTMISRTISNGISAEALWSELNARGIVDSKASHKLSADGNQQRYWKMDSSFTEFETIDADDNATNIAENRINQTTDSEEVLLDDNA